MAVTKKAPSAGFKQLRVPRDVARRLSVYAASKDMRIGAALTEAVEEYLKKRGA